MVRGELDGKTARPGNLFPPAVAACAALLAAGNFIRYARDIWGA
jgi:hypothetical protein